MSRLTGGIFSRPSGKTAGIVFGAGRTRTGKVVTARELVPPSNPNTAAQQSQRTKFSRDLFIVRALGSAIYQSDWNRSVGQLPGFQSMQSIFLGVTDANGLLVAPANTNLGTLDPPADLAVDDSGAQGFTVDWDDTNVGNGTIGDLVKFFAVPVALANRAQASNIKSLLTEDYSNPGIGLTMDATNQDVLVCVWREGQGAAAGLLSVAQWFVVSITGTP